jgi:hypothetical protein
MPGVFDRDFLLLRAEHRCEYCHIPADQLPIGLQVDHVIARQHGGGDEPFNLAMSCANCNEYKGPNLSSVDPSTGQIVRLFNPRQDRWAVHFEMDGERIRGKTPMGRATVNLLNMNAETRMDLRGQLQRDGIDLS